jgi:hypothetical protein
MIPMSKTSKPKQNRRKVKVTVKRVAKAQSEASRIESFLKREGFEPLSVREKARLKKLGFIGMPSE